MSNRSSHGSGSSAEAIPEINESIERRGFITGRRLNYPPHITQFVRTQLTVLGWGNYPDCISDTYSEEAVRDFYRYAHITYANGMSTEPELRTFVLGRHLFLNKQLLAQIWGVENTGECVYLKNSKKELRQALGFNDLGELRHAITNEDFLLAPGPEFAETALLSQLTNVNCFLVANVVPSVNTNNRVSQFRQFILYCIVAGRQLNLPYIFLKHIERTLDQSSMKLGYASIISGILQSRFGHNFAHVTPCQSSLDTTNLIRRRNHPFVHEEPATQEQQQPEPQQPQQPEPYVPQLQAAPAYDFDLTAAPSIDDFEFTRDFF